jgi:hypothetical protein
MNGEGMQRLISQTSILPPLEKVRVVYPAAGGN